MMGQGTYAMQAGSAAHHRPRFRWPRFALMALAVMIAVAASSFVLVPKAFAPVVEDDRSASVSAQTDART